MLDRRDLLKLGAVGGAAALVQGCARTDEADGAGGATAAGADFELEEWTVGDLQAAMAEGRLSSADIVAMYGERIAAIRAVTPADVQRAVRTYLTVSGRNVVRVLSPPPEAAATDDLAHAEGGAR